jgi:hypothetical protein
VVGVYRARQEFSSPLAFTASLAGGPVLRKDQWDQVDPAIVGERCGGVSVISFQLGNLGIRWHVGTRRRHARRRGRPVDWGCRRWRRLPFGARRGGSRLACVVWEGKTWVGGRGRQAAGGRVADGAAWNVVAVACGRRRTAAWDMATASRRASCTDSDSPHHARY